MSVIVGRCEHGSVQFAAYEQRDKNGSVDGMIEEAAYSFTLSRELGPVQLGGRCEACEMRIAANFALLASLPQKEG